MHASGGRQIKCAVLQPDSGAVDPLARQQLEMERGVLGSALSILKFLPARSRTSAGKAP
jgi:hypothetical protein